MPIREMLVRVFGPDDARRVELGAQAIEMNCPRPRGVALDDIVREAINEFIIAQVSGDGPKPVSYMLKIVRRLLMPGEYAAAVATRETKKREQENAALDNVTSYLVRTWDDDGR